MPYDVDWPNAEYHEILPNLYMGGHAWQVGGRRRDGRHSTVSEDPTWDYVVSAYLEDGTEKPIPQCDMRFLLFNDTEKGLSDEVWERIRSAVDEVVDRWLRGEKVLVRCQAGYNRSGMIMALVLMRLGYTASEAILGLRIRRGKDVLVNAVFEQYVRDREDEYHDPDCMAETVVLAGDRAVLLK